MPNFYCQNVTRGPAPTGSYPGVRIDLATGTIDDAAKAFIEGPYGVQPGDVIRIDPGSSMGWYTAAAQPPIKAVTTPAPALPPVGT